MITLHSINKTACTSHGRRTGSLIAARSNGLAPGLRHPHVAFATHRRGIAARQVACSTSLEHAVLLQGFGWSSWKQPGGWWNHLTSHVEDIKALGVTHVWLPPPSNSVSKEGYLPEQLYSLDSAYGSEQQLRQLLAALKAAGISPVADIVINHRCADEQDEDGHWAIFKDKVAHPGRRIDWGRWAIVCEDTAFHGQGHADTGLDYVAAPDLDHTNPELRAGLTDWLTWLQKDVGFEGWRFDYSRGYGAEYAGEYISATTGPGALNVGEYWEDLDWEGGSLRGDQSRAVHNICHWIDGTGGRALAFDFVTKGALGEAAKKVQYQLLRTDQGKPNGVLGAWPSHAVTFVDNHDTGSTQQTWPHPPELVPQAYTYYLTHPGVPCVFWEHAFDWGEGVRAAVSELVALRRRCGIGRRSRVEILAAEPDMYVARVVGGGGGDGGGEEGGGCGGGAAGEVVVKIGPRWDMGPLVPSQAEGFVMAASGKDYAVWEKRTG